MPTIRIRMHAMFVCLCVCAWKSREHASSIDDRSVGTTAAARHVDVAELCQSRSYSRTHSLHSGKHSPTKTGTTHSESSRHLTFLGLPCTSYERHDTHTNAVGHLAPIGALSHLSVNCVWEFAARISRRRHTVVRRISARVSLSRR